MLPKVTKLPHNFRSAAALTILFTILNGNYN